MEIISSELIELTLLTSVSIYAAALKASVQAVVIFKISCLQDEAAQQGRILPDIEGHVIFRYLLQRYFFIP